MRAALAAFKPHGCGLQRGGEGDHYTRDGCLRQTCRYGLYEVGVRVDACGIFLCCMWHIAAPCAAVACAVLLFSQLWVLFNDRDFTSCCGLY